MATDGLMGMKSIVLGFLLVAAGVASAQNLQLSISTNQASFVKGDRLTVSIAMSNPGVAANVDFFFGVLLPDGDTIIFFTDLAFHTGIGSLSNLASLRPIAAAVPHLSLHL